jgi:hypothetical protein
MEVTCIDRYPVAAIYANGVYCAGALRGWARAGMGKRGGVRVVYTTRLAAGEIVLLVIYSKSAKQTIPAHVLREIVQELNNDAS